MANVLIESQTMTDIANAIREKSSTVEKMKPAEMPKTIREMEVVDTGVGSRQWWLDVFSQKKNFANMFENCSMTTIPQLDTSKGKNFDHMFYQCGNLTTIPQLNTSNGTSFFEMFGYCGNLTTIPQLDTSNGTSFDGMFTVCRNLTTIPQLDTSKGKSFKSMFGYCVNLTTIPQLDTSNGTNFTDMFVLCHALKNISFVAGCIKKSIWFARSDKLTDESIQSIIDGLADLTGQTAQTITFHTTIKNKLTEEQIASATSKNWNIA